MMPASPDDAVLLADIGGTHARFALLEDGRIRDVTIWRCADFDGAGAAARAYLAARPGRRPRRAALAVAAMVDGDDIVIPNSGWRFSLDGLRTELGLDQVRAINDFAALALAVPHLAPTHRRAIGGGTPREGAPVAVIGPGTGLGVSALVQGTDGAWLPLDSEGGHVTMAAATDREAAILGVLRQRFGHVSAERVLSGQGLVNLCHAVARLDRQPAAAITPEEVSRRALAGTCPLCREALDTFFAFLGTAAANLALTLGARGGVALAGGILPRLADALAASAFRARFEDHGRFGPYLAAIPTWLIVHPHPAFLGLAGLG